MINGRVFQSSHGTLALQHFLNTTAYCASDYSIKKNRVCNIQLMNPSENCCFIQHFCDISLRRKCWLRFILLGWAWQSSGVTARRKRQWLRNQWHRWTNWGGQRRVWSYTWQDGRWGVLLINLQAFVKALSSSLSFHVSQSHWSSTFYSLTEYIESQIPPLFYGVSGEIIQGSDITGNR